MEIIYDNILLEKYFKGNNMIKKTIYLALLSFLFIGCTPSIPMAPASQDNIRKQFHAPSKDKSGLYIYRNSLFGSALIKVVYLDDKVLGSVANKTYLYTEVTPGKHTLSTTSEFSPNDLNITTVGGKNYYFNHYITMGVFVGGAHIESVSSTLAQKEIKECKLSK